MNNRIKEIRKTLNLTQVKFGERIGMKQNSIAQMEMGKFTPSDIVISAICREFSVNEIWLRTGEGDPFKQLSRYEELSSFFGDLMKSEPDVRHRLIAAISRCDIEELRMLERVATRWVEEIKKADP